MTRRFEAAWAAWNGAGAVATAGWTGAALAALGYAGVAGERVLCPSNTFMATPLAILAAGGRPVFVDCNREDLCMSFADFEAKAELRRTGTRLSHERIHRRARARPDRAHGGDRRLEERCRAPSPRPRASGPPAPPRRHGLRAVQVRRLRPDRALDRQGLRCTVPSAHEHRR